MSVADYAEIVKALRLCSTVDSSCKECPYNDPADILCECANKVGIAAADAIENLLTENAALRRMIGNLTDEKAALVKELHDSKSELSAAIAGQETVTNRNAFDAPLTLDELRDMPCEPVYIVAGYVSWWDIVSFAGTEYLYLKVEDSLPIRDYGKSWTAYRQMPKED